MRNGNILLLSRTGETEKHFHHPDVFFVDIQQNSLAQGLIKAKNICESTNFLSKSEAMRQFYSSILDQSAYVSDVMKIYKHNSVFGANPKISSNCSSACQHT
jgi:hypothetical protein